LTKLWHYCLKHPKTARVFKKNQNFRIVASDHQRRGYAERVSVFVFTN
jgi:hypothetical protein